VGGVIETVMLDVADDADDLDLSLPLDVVNLQPLAERIRADRTLVEKAIRLIRMTGTLFAVSVSASSRPFTSGIPIVRK
jgi:hypothetical protein